MDQVLSIAANVSTPLGLLGLLAAFGFYMYSRKLRSEERLVAALPAEQRAQAVDDLLTRYGIDGTGLSPEQKYDLIRQELTERSRQKRLLTIVGAVVFVICFVVATVATFWPKKEPVVTGGEPPPKPPAPKREHELRVTIRGSNLTEPAGSAIGEPGKAFRGPDLDVAIERAGEWVKKALDERFPRPGESLEVKARLRFDPAGDSRVEVEPNDLLRTDRFWIFSEHAKVGHLDLKMTSEVTRAAIEDAQRRALAAAVPGSRLEEIDLKIVVHCERPGYRLALFTLPLRPQEVAFQTRKLDRLPPPQLQVVVTGKPAPNDAPGSRLRNKLLALGLAAGGEDLQAKKRADYKQSTLPKLKDAERLAFLEAARIDAFLEWEHAEVDAPQ